MHWIETLRIELGLLVGRLSLRRPRPVSQRKGTAVVEFALGSGVLLAGFSGAFEFGYALIQYNRLESAVAQGARYASMLPYDSTTETPSATFLSAVQNMVLYGSPSAGNAPALNGLTPGNINLVVTFSNGVPSSVEISVTGYAINALFGSFTLNGKPRVTYSYQGVWAPV